MSIPFLTLISKLVQLVRFGACVIVISLTTKKVNHWADKKNKKKPHDNSQRYTVLQLDLLPRKLFLLYYKLYTTLYVGCIQLLNKTQLSSNVEKGKFMSCILQNVLRLSCTVSTEAHKYEIQEDYYCSLQVNCG